MLTSLTIQNIALVERLTVRLQPGLTVITGETGAGKSIVIDALSLALGERANMSLIRDGEAKGIVEAEFDAESLNGLRLLVEEAGADWQPVLILRREITGKGTSRCFVNDSPVQVGTLKSIGDALVDIHGQHEHQSLLRPDTHLGILDAYADIEDELNRYRLHFESFHQSLRDLRKARETVDSIEQRKTAIEKELRDIDAVDPKDGEDEELERQLRIAEFAERINAASSEILYLLNESEQNAAAALGKTRKLLEDLVQVDRSLAPLQDEIGSALASVDEIARTIRSYMDSTEFDAQQTEAMKQRHMELTALKKKLRLSLPDILERRNALREEYTGLDSMDVTLARLEREVEERRGSASAAGAKLHSGRIAASRKLAKAVEKELASLGMKNCTFDTRISVAPAPYGSDSYLIDDGNKVAADQNGWNIVEFYLSANLGEEVKPLAKVVSGGEASRIMLALKTIFAKKDTIPVLVFDEIDVGVSGGIARKVGEAMHTLAKTHQILAITHLPQIAGMGRSHILVEKSVQGKRTITRVRAIEGEERAKEIARLLSGDTITDTALQNAKELILNE